ncbi:hypothetical protein SAMN05216388_101872 [Halorientalis persicus]|uniref:Uncharacterized protein n=1 Tax=Halorientalis persicus TaxID=1367881 RepID=A0A1H8SDB9_9EURY|nr:hypothetical protein SAMN05216388_101872 [Halorientalis persicus]
MADETLPTPEETLAIHEETEAGYPAPPWAGVKADTRGSF